MDDDYVAQIMAQEAQESSRNYSTQGLGAYMPRRPAGNAPKPNTRFLRHLIKETDNHNMALKHKEEREAKQRMRQLKESSKSSSITSSHSSRRQDRQSSARDSDRRRRDDHEDGHRSSRRRHRSRSSSVERDRSRRRHRNEYYDRKRDEHGDRRDRHRHETSRKDQRYHKRSRSRSRSPRTDRASRRERDERHRRSESPTGIRSSHSRRSLRHQGSRRDEDATQSRRHSHDRVSKLHKKHKSPSPAAVSRRSQSDDESDPLEDLVGPLPPQADAESSTLIRSRGRGAYNACSSTIDAHFAKDYDPTLDVQPDDNDDDGPITNGSSRRPVAGLMTQEDDWDMALEALRDRAIWKQKGEERLRAAGINEDTIDRWKNNPAFSGLDSEGRPEDVRWSKKGESREWDRGKVVDDEGHTNIRAPW